MLLICALLAADYTQFRDTVVGEDVPSAFSIEDGTNVAWTAALEGRGLSTPLVVGDRVFVTASGGIDGERLMFFCFDDATGQRLWTRQFWATGRTASHPKTANAAPTPASDGERIFGFFSSGDLIAVDLDGNLQWVRGLQVDYPNASNSLGMSSSLAVADGVVVAMSEADAEAVSVGVDAVTGEDVWTRTDRPTAANWTSPVAVDLDGQSLVLLQSSKGLEAVGIADGETVWNYAEGASTIPSSALGEGIVVVPSDGLTALSVATGEVEWKNSRVRPSTASPIVRGDAVYVLNSSGVLIALNAATGDDNWKLRLGGKYSATPVASAEHLYFVDEEGTVRVVSSDGSDGEVVSEVELGERVLATPAVRGDALYVRSDSTLWKIAPSDAK